MLTDEQKIKVIYYLMKNRIINPSGTFDKAGRWYPDNYYSCCSEIRQPTRSYPYSYMVHCRTMKHIKIVFNKSPNVYINPFGHIIRLFDKEEIPLLINDNLPPWEKTVIRNVLENKYDWIE